MAWRTTWALRDARRNAPHRRQEAPDAFSSFLAEAGLGRVEEPLKRCGIATLQQLRDRRPRL